MNGSNSSSRALGAGEGDGAERVVSREAVGAGGVHTGSQRIQARGIGTRSEPTGQARGAGGG